MLSVLAAAALASLGPRSLPTGPPAPYRAWGLEAAGRIREEYRLPNGLYADAIERKPGLAITPSGPAFNWGVGVWMTALNAAAEADPKWKPELRAFVDATRVYWNDKGPVPGYDVLPGPKDVDRYYDDNQWMVMALVDASRILRDPKVFGWAEETLTFVLSGEDDKLGGGIYWHEPKKESKNTCSNGPAAAACLAVYERTRKPETLARAKSLYAWTKRTLQDPEDGLFWDSIRLDGTIEKTKWSYNTALMIRTAAELGRLTGERAYKDEAERMAVASEARWVDPATGAIRDGGRFAHLLLDSWRFVPTPARREKARRALRWVHDHGRTPGGLYGPQFDRTPDPAKTRFELIDQASAARAFLSAP